MAIVVGFAPFILFAVLMDISVSLALWVSFAAAFGVGMYDFLHTRSIRLLDVSGIVLFGLVSFYAGFIQPSIATEAVRFIVDAGLLIVALISIVLRNPLTLPYAREQVPRSEWGSSEFKRTNYILTAVWALALAIMAAADGAVAFGQYISGSLDVAASLLALAAAVVFTARYPTFLRHQHQA